jgi:4'-phosphopantetheinyl transferase
LDLLNEEEKIRANKYRIEQKRKTYIFTKALLKTLLPYYAQKDSSKFICKNTYGKPYIKKSDLYFNISHTQDMSIIAFSKQHEIGIDVESMHYDSNIMDISTKYFTKREKHWIDNLPKNKQKEGFLYCWVRKEAYIKALGLGLSLPLDSFHVLCENQHLMSNKCFHIHHQWYLHPLDISTQHLGAICIQSPKIDVSSFDAHDII